MRNASWCLLVLAVLVVACGSEKKPWARHDQDGVRALHRAHWKAFDTGDYERACAFYGGPGFDEQTCLRDMQAASGPGFVRKPDSKVLQSIQVMKVSIRGDRATTSRTAILGPARLIYEDGEWQFAPRAVSGPVVRAELFAYRVNEGGRVLEVLVGRAGNDRIVRTSQHSDSNGVTVRVVLRPDPDGQDLSLVHECVAVRLDEPLAERQVLNGDTGRQIHRAKPGSEAAALLPRECSRRR